MFKRSIMSSNSVEKWFKATVLFIIIILSITGSFFSAFYLLVNVNEIPGKITETTILEKKGNQQKAVKATLYEDKDLKAVETVNSDPEGLFIRLVGFFMGISLDLSNVTTTLNEDKDLNAGETATSDPEGLFIRSVDFFKGISLDLSGVTPFLLFLFFICSCIGCGKLLFNPAKYKDNIHEAYPFPKNHESTWIQLGFIGTLWAFFIIGLRMAKIRNVGGVELVDILTKAFGTAIISTLTAVVLVYIFSPVLRNSLRWIFGLYIQQPIDSIDQRLSTLSEKIEAAGKETEKCMKSIGWLNDNVKKCSEEIDALSNKIEGLAGTDFMKAFETLVKASESQTLILKVLKEKGDEMENRDTKILANLQSISRKLDTVNDSFSTKIDDMIDTFKTERQENQKAFDSAVKVFDDKVNKSNHFIIGRILNFLVLFIRKIKSSWKEYASETQLKIDEVNIWTRELLETELAGIAGEIEDLNTSVVKSVVKIGENRKAAEDRMDTLEKKYSRLKPGTRIKWLGRIWPSIRSEEEKSSERE